jgi:hypothetical protein
LLSFAMSRKLTPFHFAECGSSFWCMRMLYDTASSPLSGTLHRDPNEEAVARWNELQAQLAPPEWRYPGRAAPPRERDGVSPQAALTVTNALSGSPAPCGISIRKLHPQRGSGIPK